MSYDGPERGAHQPDSESRTTSVAATTLGVAIQLVTGSLVFALPPGGSVTTWLLYIALGAVGVLHILLGAVLWNRSHDPLASTASFESDDVPWHAKRCPGCDEVIADALHAGKRRCPACGSHFTTRDLGWRSFDPAGEPASLSPHELRLSGPHMVTLLAVLATILIGIAIYSGIAWPAKPGP